MKFASRFNHFRNNFCSNKKRFCSGSQAYIPEYAFKQAQEQGSLNTFAEKKKKMKQEKSKKIPKPEMTLEQEDDMDRASMELARKMANARIDLQVQLNFSFCIHYSIFEVNINDTLIINNFIATSTM